MAPDQELLDRDAAVRSILVERVRHEASGADAPARTGRLRAGIVTGAVFAVVVALSVLAIRSGTGRGALPVGGETPTTSPTSTGLPTASPPAGVLLGRFTSEDGPKQTHTIHPNGLALSVNFACAGDGEYFVHIPHAEDEGGGCGGSSGGTSNKGTQGSVDVTITTEPSQRWTLTIVGVPETYVTPRPVLAPTDASGAAVRFCTATDLSARYETYRAPWGRSGQIEYTNTSASTCALAGYPKVLFLDGDEPLGDHFMEWIDQRSSMEKGLVPVIVASGRHAWTQTAWSDPEESASDGEGTCVRRTVHALRVDLGNDLAGPEQAGTLDVPIGTATACLNGAHGALGKYGQISSTVFVDYSAAK